MIINIVTGIITARSMGATGRGEQAALLMLPQLLAYCLTLGLPTSITFNIKKNPNLSRSLVTFTLIFAFGLGVVATLIGILIIPFLFEGYAGRVIVSAQYLMIFSITYLIGIVLTGILKARDNFKLFNRWRYIEPIIILMSLLILYFSNNISPLTAALSYILPSLPMFLIIFIYILREYRVSFNNFVDSSKRVTSYGIRSYGIDLVTNLSGKLDQVLIAAFLNSTAIGLYVISLSLSKMIGIIHNSIVTVLFPRMLTMDKKQMIDTTLVITRITLVAILIIDIILFFLSPFVIELLYGPSFKQADIILKFLIFEVLFSGCAVILSQPFMSLNKPGAITTLQVLSMIINLLLLWLLVPKYGLLGAGIATLLSSILKFLTVVICYPVILKTPLPRFYMNKSDILYLKKIIINR